MKRALVICSNANKRAAVYQLAMNAPELDQVSTLPSFEAALSLDVMRPFDYVLIEDEFETSRTASFIELARKSPVARNASFILLLKEQDQQRQSLAANMMAGLHGFLCDPLSIGALQDALRLADGVKNGSSTERLKAASGLMLFDYFKPSDGWEEGGGQGKSLWEQLQDTYQKYKELTGESLRMPVVRNLTPLKASQRIRFYTGVSERVRKLFERKFFGSIKPNRDQEQPSDKEEQLDKEQQQQD